MTLRAVGSASGDSIPVKAIDYAVRVVTGAVGTPQTFVLNAIAAPTDVAANRISDATGYKAFRVRPMNGLNAAVFLPNLLGTPPTELLGESPITMPEAQDSAPDSQIFILAIMRSFLSVSLSTQTESHAI